MIPAAQPAQRAKDVSPTAQAWGIRWRSEPIAPEGRKNGAHVNQPPHPRHLLHVRSHTSSHRCNTPRRSRLSWRNPPGIGCHPDRSWRNSRSCSYVDSPASQPCPGRLPPDLESQLIAMGKAAVVSTAQVRLARRVRSFQRQRIEASSRDPLHSRSATASSAHLLPGRVPRPAGEPPRGI